jgi:hypothetical protein
MRHDKWLKYKRWQLREDEIDTAYYNGILRKVKNAVFTIEIMTGSDSPHIQKLKIDMSDPSNPKSTTLKDTFG